jgi:hypothetical protein
MRWGECQRRKFPPASREVPVFRGRPLEKAANEWPACGCGIAVPVVAGLGGQTDAGASGRSLSAEVHEEANELALKMRQSPS